MARQKSPTKQGALDPSIEARFQQAFMTTQGGFEDSHKYAEFVADLVGEPHPEWTAAADVIDRAINGNLAAFEPKERWAMDWYYPVMTGAMTADQLPAEALC